MIDFRENNDKKQKNRTKSAVRERRGKREEKNIGEKNERKIERIIKWA